MFGTVGLRGPGSVLACLGLSLVLDACCGSGLMLLPLLEKNKAIFGIDFNVDACRSAARNGFPILRGDAYSMPLADGCIDEVINCQFFNQQSSDGVAAFVDETTIQLG